MKSNLSKAPYTIPKSEPFAAYVNGSIVFDQRMPAAALAQQAISAYGGDPLVGVVLQGSVDASHPNGLKWEDATQVQQAIYEWYTEEGVDTDGISEVFDAYRGPYAPWNFSYTQWGLPFTNGGKK
jgi:hypothetical protein